MLTFAEELLLLALDDKKGVIKSLPCHSMRFALTGAMLMELAMDDRIDTDLDTLQVINPEPTGNQLLDEFLERLKNSEVPRNTEYWLSELAWNTENLQDRTLQQLVDKGILKLEDRKILWVFARRCYPLIDDREVKEVRLRLRELVFNQDIPDPREAVLIGLLYACNMVDTLFTEQELPEVMPRLTQLAKLDLIGREVDQSIRDIYSAMTAHNKDRVID